MSNLSTTIGESDGQIHVETLPPARGHEVHFIQLFQNLIGNAVKYAQPHVPPEIRVSAAEQGNEWLVRVQDNGQGIAPRYQKQIFGVFKRLHGKDIPGTGIGLAICYRVVERAGGRIWVESAGPGTGSTFCFTLPKV
jgi:signal transduction histidine kinase